LTWKGVGFYHTRMRTKAVFTLLTLLSGLTVLACSESSDGPVESPKPAAEGGAGGQDGGADVSSGGDTGVDVDAKTEGGGGKDVGAGGEGTEGGLVDAQPDTPADAPPEEPLTAKRAAAEMGYGFNLGEFFESTKETPRTFEVAKKKIDAYYAMGFRNLRIPITWTEKVNGTRLVHDPLVGDVDHQHPRLAEITKVIDYALSLPGLYVVINAHHEKELKEYSRDTVLQRLWADITEMYADRDHRLLFEFLNEPHRSGQNEMPGPDLVRMTGMAYEEVRARDPERIVIIGGNRVFYAAEMGNVWKNLDKVGGGNDPFVMATFHHYNPWDFCGDHKYPYTYPWTKEEQEKPMNTMKKWAEGDGQGMPVYIGEWGVGWKSGESKPPLRCNNIREWYSTFHRDSAAPRGQPTAVWDDGGWFKVFDYQTGEFDNNLAECIVGPCAWDGTGRYDGCGK